MINTKLDKAEKNDQIIYLSFFGSYFLQYTEHSSIV